jgi:group I intron endonuclease
LRGGFLTVKTPVPHTSGIYRLLCVPTGKFYIGSAIDLRERWNRHRGRLRCGNHVNCHLQQAWNKYGEASFSFSVLECVDPADLLCREQVWLDGSGCTDRSIGFNIYDVAGSPGTPRAQCWRGFINPEGNDITITNLMAFCRQQGLNASAMIRLASGKSKLRSHKGWTHRNSPRKREYVKTYDRFVDPEGRPAGLITNLAAFCREHRLDKTHMVAVAHGRICSHRGWTCVNGRRRLGLQTHTGFVNPDGKSVEITNLQEFCREHGLNPINMRGVKSGQRRSYKGWIWRPSDERA